jgi:hypothetical protein
MVILGRRAARREEEPVEELVEEPAIICEEHVCEEHVLGLSTDDGDAPPPFTDVLFTGDGDAPPPPPPPLLPSPAPPHALALPAPLALYRPS